MTDKELFVRAHWENIEVRRDQWVGWIFFTTNALYRAVNAETQDELYTKGAEFTSERLEQIRQLREEIRMVKRQLACQPNETEIMEYSAADVRLSQANVARWSRILASREAALADLQQGMTT